jgi:hypothetical protein
MPVDGTSSIDMARPRPDVAQCAMDPANATAQYENIKSVTLKTSGPVGVGAQIASQATFLGRSLAYTYEVVAYDPTRRLIMRTADSPFPMEMSYLFEDTS